MYIKRIAEFINDVQHGISENVIAVLNHGVHSDSELLSWRQSLPVVADILNALPDDVKENAEIVLEAKYRIEEKRTDAVIVGTKNGVPALILIENKGWSNLVNYCPIGANTVSDPYHDNRPISHPCRQVKHYKDILRYTNSFVQENNALIYSVALLMNAAREERDNMVGPFDARFSELIAENPVFVGREGFDSASGALLSAYIADKIDGGYAGLAERVYSSPVNYSREYQSILANVMGNREQLISLLDDRQIEIFDEICAEVYRLALTAPPNGAGAVPQREKAVYIIKGRPGTGKTFVAVSLLAYMYRNAVDRNITLRALLLLKNRDPRLALEREMGISGGAVKFGLKGDNGEYHCLICDELTVILNWYGNGTTRIQGILLRQHSKWAMFPFCSMTDSSTFILTTM